MGSALLRHAATVPVGKHKVFGAVCARPGAGKMVAKTPQTAKEMRSCKAI